VIETAHGFEEWREVEMLMRGVGGLGLAESEDFQLK